jgi:four helix bundle protein
LSTNFKTMNGKIERFEDLEVWKESMRLATRVYESLKKATDYGLRDQMQRSAVSIPSNIAEGYERKSNKEFIQFLYIAKASCGELRTQLYLTKQTKILDKVICDELLELSKKISAMLFKFIKTRKEKF